MALPLDQVEYGINVRNHFDLLNSDDEELDPQALIEAAKQQGKLKADKAAADKKAEKKRTGAIPASVKEVAPPVIKDAAPAGRGGKENRPRGRGGLRGEGRPPRAGRGGRGGGEGGPTNLPPRLAGQNGGGFGNSGGQWEEDRFGESGRGRGRGAPRGGRGRGGAPREVGSFGGGFGGGFGGEEGGEKVSVEGGEEGFRGGFRGRGRGGRGRQFDRKSGSESGARPGAEKRGGHGKGNWGTAEDELAGETENLNTSGNLSDAPPAEEKKEEATEPKEEEADKAEEVKELTLDEWRAQQGPKQKPAFKLRKAGEGEKNKEWDKLVPMEKEPITHDDSVEYIIEEKASKKNTVPIDWKFTARPSGGGFEARGRGARGGGGRGGDRGGRGGGGRGRGSPASGPPTNFASRGAGGSRGGGRTAEFHMDSSMFPELGAQ